MNEVLFAVAWAIIRLQLSLSVASVAGIVFSRFFETDAVIARRCQHLLLVAALLAPALASLRPVETPFPAPIKVYSGFTGDIFSAPLAETRAYPTLRSDPGANGAEFETTVFRYGAVLLLLVVSGSLGVSLVRCFRSRGALNRLVRTSIPLRSVGQVSIRASAALPTPLSSRIGGRAIVLVPQSTLLNWERLKLSIAHELQHHRQRDFAWLPIIEVARAVGAFNPLLSRWLARIAELHELACDQSLLGRRGINNHAYARCLYETACEAAGMAPTLVGTAGMAATPGLLLRRMKMILETKSRTAGSWSARVTATLAVCLIAVGA